MVVSSKQFRDDDPFRFLPMRMNWDRPLVESYEFKTDIIDSFDGKEQRIAYRKFPRRELSFTALASGTRKLDMEYVFRSSMNRTIGLPHPARGVKTTVPMIPGAPSAAITGDISGFSIGQTVAIWNGDVIESRRLIGLTSSGMTFFDSTDTEFPVGTTIHPVVLGRLQDEPRARHVTSNVMEMQIQFLIDPGTSPYSPGGGGTFLEFREVWMKRPNWSEGVDVSYLWPKNTIDYGIGRIAHYDPLKFPTQINRWNFVDASREDVKSAVDFFCRHLGQAREFVVPTWEDDIPYDFIAAGSLSILIDGLQFASIYKDSSVFRRLVLRMKDGRYIHKKVDFIEALEETGTSVVWVADNLPIEPLTPATIFGISWVPITRFATDRLEIEWLTDKVARYSFTVRTLENFDI